jgi:hypothetical protein
VSPHDVLAALDAAHRERTGRPLPWPPADKMVGALDAAAALLAAFGINPPNEGNTK